ncbi:MAG: undecaprenyl/decaprenyl-phosphate alpha-N-acetylglucosaminyl 1-phosphate transferase [Prevotella sp.]|nr:undecaprenyl/decaprenyl-phosphate alpha-N-acetylglucosaminyl 1-phosphate transferase [Prevotella sp.]
MTIYLLGAFFLSMICGLVFTPLILDFCKRKKLYDLPNDRKVHKNAIPRLGGISFLPSMMTAFTVMLLYFTWMRDKEIAFNTWSATYVMGVAIIYLTGIVDDLVGLKAKSKFLVQVITACLLPMAGLYINNLYGLFGIEDIPYYIGIPLTIFVLVFVDNAINLIDGIDGLAAGLTLIALTCFLVYFIYYDVFMHTYSILVAGLMGALIAFLYFNLFGSVERNTKIFMGDSGSLSLGFTLGFLAVKCAMNNTAIWPVRPEAIIVGLTLLIVPTADVARVTLYRLRHHRPLFDADKNHIHHKLMRAGLSQHQALVAILLLAVAYIVLNSLLFPLVPATLLVVIDVALFCAVNGCINYKLKTTA